METTKRQKTARALFQGAEELLRRRLWKRVDSHACILLRVPGEESPVLASILGGAEEKYGFSLYRGKHAFAQLTSMLSSSFISSDLIDEISMLGFIQEAFQNIPPQHRGLIRQAELQPHPSQRLPYFLAKHPHQGPREPRPREIQTVLYSIRAILRLDDMGKLKPPSLHTAGPLLAVDVAGNPADPDISWDLEPRPEILDAESEFPLPSLDLDQPRGKHCWLVGLLPLPIAAEGSHNHLCSVAILEEPSGLCARLESVLAGRTKEACKIVLDTLGGNHEGAYDGLPANVLFTDSALHYHLTPILTEAGIECRLDPKSPTLSAFHTDFVAHVRHLKSQGHLP